MILQVAGASKIGQNPTGNFIFQHLFSGAFAASFRGAIWKEKSSSW